jgi:hypothetical protein
MRVTRRGRRDKGLRVSLHYRTILNIQLGKCIADLIGSTPLGGVRPFITKALYYL